MRRETGDTFKCRNPLRQNKETLCLFSDAASLSHLYHVARRLLGYLHTYNWLNTCNPNRCQVRSTMEDVGILQQYSTTFICYTLFRPTDFVTDIDVREERVGETISYGCRNPSRLVWTGHKNVRENARILLRLWNCTCIDCKISTCWVKDWQEKGRGEAES